VRTAIAVKLVNTCFNRVSPTKAMTPIEKRAQLWTIFATILVSTSFPIGAAITQGLDSVVLTLMRFSIAAVFFGPFVAWKYGLTLPSLGDLARYAVLSACLVGFFWAMFEALRYTSPLNTATIFTLTPSNSSHGGGGAVEGTFKNALVHRVGPGHNWRGVGHFSR